MRRDPRLYIDDILDAISNIREYTTGQNYEIFQQDRKTRDAVVRNLEIIGEAAGRTRGGLLVQRKPHRLVRRKDGRLRKETVRYQASLPAIADGFT
jgi:hypothetical protein